MAEASSGWERLIRGAETVIAVLSALLVAGIIALLVREALTTAASPPDLSVREEPGSGGQVRYVVVNRGGKTAAQVTLALVLRDGGGGRVADRRVVTIDYVPPHSEVRGGFVLGPDDAALAGTLRVEGYVDP
jgi:uncharacterized protein (TIGR02588 family)